MFLSYAYILSRFGQSLCSTFHFIAGRIFCAGLRVSVVAVLIGSVLSFVTVAEAGKNNTPEPGTDPPTQGPGGGSVPQPGTEPPAHAGFGATSGGSKGQAVYVTNLNDAGPGSLRDALSEGNRHIVFNMAGAIALKSRLYVKGAHITIDGFSAPSPGITIKNYALKILGNRGAHDVIVQGIRMRITATQTSGEDGISIGSGAYNIVIDHCSVSGATDESIGITDDAHDVTVSWSILGNPVDGHNTNMLIGFGATRISLHHNLFIQAQRRNPWVAYDPVASAPEVQADVRNNLMWDVSGAGSDHGTVVFDGGKANIVNNYFKAASNNQSIQKRAVVVCKSKGENAPEDKSFCEAGARRPAAGAYVAGNISHDGWTDYLNTKGTEVSAFAAAPVATTDACTAAGDVLAAAGVGPLDATDLAYLSTIELLCGN